MQILTADEAMSDRLRGILEPIEIHDADGKLLGHFTPYVSPEERASYEKALKQVDRAELKRRKEQHCGKGRTTAEVLEHLRSLENQG